MAHKAKNIPYLVLYRKSLASHFPRGSDLISKKTAFLSGFYKCHLYGEVLSVLNTYIQLTHSLYLFLVLIFLPYHYLYQGSPVKQNQQDMYISRERDLS